MFSSSKICIANLRSGSLTLGELEAVTTRAFVESFFVQYFLDMFGRLTGSL